MNILVSSRRRSLSSLSLLPLVAGALVALGCSSGSPDPGGAGAGGSGVPSSPARADGGSASGQPPATSPPPGPTAQTVGAQCGQIGAAECQHVLADCAPVGADAGGHTVGDQCREIGQALCGQSVQCGSSASVDACMTTVLANCCGNGGLCGVAAASGEDAVVACSQAITAQSCTAAASGSPAACQGVVKPVSTPEAMAACQTQMVDGCCGTRGACGETAQSSSSSITTCAQDIGASSCAPSSTLPASCQGVVKVAAPAAAPRDAAIGAGLSSLSARPLVR